MIYTKLLQHIGMNNYKEYMFRCKGVQLDLSLNKTDQSENVSEQNSKEKNLDKTSTKNIMDKLLQHAAV